jgi:hypothetical protein
LADLQRRGAMKKRSDWDMLMEVEEELHWARSNLVHMLNTYLDDPDPDVWKGVEECRKQYAHWFNEARRLRSKVGAKLRRRR